MRLYRISRIEHLEDFSGRGASYGGGGRWNEAGVPALYFAQSPAVSMLEMANYLPSPRLVPPGYRLAVYDVADDAHWEQWQVDDLPADWRDFPYPLSTQRMGTEWLVRAEATLLVVPSAAVPGGRENNVLVNPVRLAPGTISLVAVEKEIYSRRAFDALTSCD